MRYVIVAMTDEGTLSILPAMVSNRTCCKPHPSARRRMPRVACGHPCIAAECWRAVPASNFAAWPRQRKPSYDQEAKSPRSLGRRRAEGQTAVARGRQGRVGSAFQIPTHAPIPDGARSRTVSAARHGANQHKEQTARAAAAAGLLISPIPGIEGWALCPFEDSRRSADHTPTPAIRWPRPGRGPLGRGLISQQNMRLSRWLPGRAV